MRKRTAAAVLSLSLLALGGCSGPAPEPEAAPSAQALPDTGPCTIREPVPACSKKLTALALAGMDAFDELPDPTLEQVQADIDLDAGSAAWASGCRQWETYTVGDVLLVQGCLEALEKLVSAGAALQVSP